MGKIIRNGVEYSGATEDATAVNYNNSLSGLNAQTVQEAIDEMKEDFGGLRFGTDGEGNYGYFKGDDTFVPFKNSGVDLLWENPTPVDAFEAQTISLDLTKYDGIIITFIGQPNWTAETGFYISKNITQLCSVSVEQDSQSATGAWYRMVSVSDTEVIIGLPLDSASVTKAAVIPIKIYGVAENNIIPDIEIGKGIKKINNFTNTKTLATNLPQGYYIVHLTKADANLYGALQISNSLNNTNLVNYVSISKAPDGNYFSAGEELNLWFSVYGSGDITIGSLVGTTYPNLCSGEIYEVLLDSNIENIFNPELCIVTNKTSTDVKETFTPSKTSTCKIYGIRGSSNTTIELLQGNTTIFTTTLTTDSGILKYLEEVSLLANTEYTLVIKGLGNTSTIATAFVIYGSNTGNSMTIINDIEFTQLDASSVQATVDVPAIPKNMTLIGKAPLGGYNGLKYYYVSTEGEEDLSVYYYAADNVNWTHVFVTKEIVNDKLVITITSEALGYYRLYGKYNLHYSL